MGFLVLAVLAAATFLALWRLGRLDRTGLQLLGAVLLLALAGYVWQGRPGLEGSPRAAAERPPLPPTAFQAMRRGIFGSFDPADNWLIISESFHRRGNTSEAAATIKAALRRRPNNAVLWTGYGNALLVHGGGLSPAAELAYRRAMMLAPKHPGPLLFYGIALAQSGRFDEAEPVLRRSLTLAPPNAEWRAPLEQQLALLQAARARGAARP
ncbi:MAG TPA: tetratricopeptide repeat protein [Allosphingosinicella sp.]|jgi:cytochrome c-type biogenesis protein CcmH/NrfG